MNTKVKAGINKTIKIINFKDSMISNSMDVDQLGKKIKTPDIEMFEVESWLYNFLSATTVDGGLMTILI